MISSLIRANSRLDLFADVLVSYRGFPTAVRDFRKTNSLHRQSHWNSSAQAQSAMPRFPFAPDQFIINVPSTRVPLAPIEVPAPRSALHSPAGINAKSLFTARPAPQKRLIDLVQLNVYGFTPVLAQQIFIMPQPEPSSPHPELCACGFAPTRAIGVRLVGLP